MTDICCCPTPDDPDRELFARWEYTCPMCPKCFPEEMASDND